MPEALERFRRRPVLAAGGIHDRATARAARALGASGVSVGTRFLLTHESHAHDAYKARLLEADSTLVTLLFGLGWPAKHRVVPNAATVRWCTDDPLGPTWLRALNAGTSLISRVVPPRAVGALLSRQRPGSPLFSPAALTREMSAHLADATPLYAGECATTITALASAEDVVREIAKAH
jgi:NAD(P)H-dependent flavin oxidoreductase YrpB (nitropropane dioxygenase family)